GVLGRGTQGHGDIVGDLVAGNRNHCGMPDGTLGKDGDIGSATTDIHHAHAQFLLVLGQHRVAGGQLLEDHVLHFQAAAADALLDVLHRVDRKSTRLNSSHVKISY